MAQWQRARLITARTLDQNQLPVYHPLVALQKLLVITTFKRNRYSSAAERLKTPSSINKTRKCPNLKMVIAL